MNQSDYSEAALEAVATWAKLPAGERKAAFPAMVKEARDCAENVRYDGYHGESHYSEPNDLVTDMLTACIDADEWDLVAFVSDELLGEELGRLDHDTYWGRAAKDAINAALLAYKSPTPDKPLDFLSAMLSGQERAHHLAKREGL